MINKVINNIKNNKYSKYIIIGILLLTIIGIITKSNDTLDSIKVITNDNIPEEFALYVEQNEGSGDYTESNTFPIEDYYLNTNDSYCMDTDSTIIPNIMSYSNGRLSITTSKTLFCYLYFSKDTTNPIVTFYGPLSTDSSNPTEVESKTFSGVITDSSKVTFSINGSDISLNDNKFSLTIPIVKNVTSTISYTATDEAGNVSTGNYYVKYVSPDITINSLYSNNTIGKNVSITGTGCSDTVWNNKYQRFEISNVTEDYDCTATYTNSSTTTKLSDYIIGLVGTTQGSGEIVNENDNIQDSGYRYQGRNPNNYVWFNNELWRIIGVFGNNYHGKSDNLVKIVRDTSIGILAFNNGEGNSFETSYIYNILNGSYINASNSWIDTQNCYAYSSTTTTCDYTKVGIKNNYLSLVEDAYWLINPLSNSSCTKSETFSTSNKTSNAFKIGLINANEYTYASLDTCTSNIDSYSSTSCAGSNWLYGKGYEWTMTPYSTDNFISLTEYGKLSLSSPTIGHSVRPALYLKANTLYLSGTGTIEDPYILSSTD